MAKATHELTRHLPHSLSVLLGFAALAWGLATAQAVLGTTPSLRSDVALKMAAGLILPIPLGILDLLSTPRHAATRRMLGESPTHAWQRVRWQAALWLGLALLSPVATWAMAPAEVDLHRTAILGAITAICATFLSLALVSAALAAVAQLARGSSGSVWGHLTGGSAFGPAETAPLLYAPAFAFVAALVPATFAAALWGAEAQLASESVLTILGLVAISASALGAARVRKRVAACWPMALVAVEQAHATRFAQQNCLPEPPVWLVGSKPSLGLLTLGRALWRRQPLAPWWVVGLTLLAAWLPRTLQGPSWAMAASLVCMATGLSWFAHLQARKLTHDALWPALAWLGQGPSERQANLRTLSLRLAMFTWIALGWIALGAAPLPVILGLVVGAALPTAMADWTRADSPWSPRLALLVFALGLSGVSLCGTPGVS